MNQKKNLIKFTPLILAIGLLIILIIVGANFTRRPRVEADNAGDVESSAKIEIDHHNFDFGTISMAKGKVNHNWKIKNTSQNPLQISNLITSCMCTTAQLKADGKAISPIFGMPMHGDEKSNWSEEIASGKAAEIEATFDPAAHGPEGTGPIERIISFKTNDPDKKTVELHFSANVIP